MVNKGERGTNDTKKTLCTCERYEATMCTVCLTIVRGQLYSRQVIKRSRRVSSYESAGKKLQTASMCAAQPSPSHEKIRCARLTKCLR